MAKYETDLSVSFYMWIIVLHYFFLKYPLIQSELIKISVKNQKSPKKICQISTKSIFIKLTSDFQTFLKSQHA